MKKSLFLIPIIPFLLASCTFSANDSQKNKDDDQTQDVDDHNDDEEEEETHTHKDSNHDHKCDECNLKITNCKDIKPKDHKCDICGTLLSECVDSNKDGKCDVCGKTMSSQTHTHADLNHDHKCDECGLKLTDCSDVNPKDHKCDVCGDTLTSCVDTNPKDHKCDICGKTLSSCADTNPKDHKCDVCGKTLSSCVDSNKDGKCDICGKTMSTPTPSGDYTSTWPTEYQKYVTTYLNGMVPCYLNVNKKCLFTGYETLTYSNDIRPYFHPYIKNTSPDINYVYDYGVILRDAGFTHTEDFTDDSGDKNYCYEKGDCKVQYCKYRGTDNVYYFSVLAYYDYDAFNDPVSANTYNMQYDDSTLGLKADYAKNNKTVTIKNWSIKLNDVMKQGDAIQLKKNTGKITISGAISSIYLCILRNPDACFVKAGTSSSSAKYIFNKGGLFAFPSGTKYVEISAVSRVLEFEFMDITP